MSGRPTVRHAVSEGFSYVLTSALRATSQTVGTGLRYAAIVMASGTHMLQSLSEELRASAAETQDQDETLGRRFGNCCQHCPSPEHEAAHRAQQGLH